MSDVSETLPVSQENVPMVETKSEAKPEKKRRPKQAEKAGPEVTGPKVKKVAAVREYLVEHPEARGKDIVAALAEKGITVTTAYVSVVRGDGEKKKQTKGGTFQTALQNEKAALLRRIEAIDTLLE